MSLVARISRFGAIRNLASFKKNFAVRNHSKISGTHLVSNLEKKFLVWTGKFKTVEEVPQYLAPEIVDRAKNRIRIRVANIMMVATLVGCLCMAIMGKRAHQRGESVQKQNLDWHQNYKEEAEKAKAKAA